MQLLQSVVTPAKMVNFDMEPNQVSRSWHMPVAVSSGTKDVPKTNWFDVKMFEELAAQMAELPKGTRVIVTGRLRQDVYPDADGVKQYRTVIYAEEAGPSLRWTPRS